jgi:hypothetical protein
MAQGTHGRVSTQVSGFLIGKGVCAFEKRSGGAETRSRGAASYRGMAQLRRSSTTAALVIGILAMAHVHAAPRPIDVRRSTVTIFVSKSGLFSALADDHVIRAPIAGGTISDTPPLAIALRIQAGDLAVVDPNLDEKKKADVRSRMLGPDVLDAAEFPTIVFESTAIEPAGDNRWTVSGRVTIRGVTRDVRFPAVRETGRYRASTILKQRDFGIQPIRVAGGTVRVKDEIRLEFDIAAADS